MKVQLSGHYGYGRILKTMVPSAGMMAVTSVYTIVDGLFVSNFTSSTAFAGMNLVWPALAMIAALGLMLGAGGSALVSKTLGEGNEKRACELFTTLTRLAAIIGVVVAALLFLFMDTLVDALGAEGDMTGYAVSYGRIVCICMPFFILQMFFQFFYMTAEKPQLGMWVSIVCAVANIGLDALFVVVFEWGLNGAALATSIALSISGLLPLLWFASRRNRTHLKYVRGKTDWKAIGNSCVNGLSEFVGNIALNIVGICYNLQLMRYIGENGVSAYGIIMYIGFLFASVFIGYNISISQVVAYNYGAGNREEIRSVLRKSIKLLGLIGLGLSSLAFFGARPIAGVFVGYDRELCELTVHATRIYMLSFLICGFNMFVSAWFTALGNGAVSAVAAFTRTLVFELSAVFILPAVLGIDGIWLSVNAAEVLALLLSVILMFSFKKCYGY